MNPFQRIALPVGLFLAFSALLVLGASGAASVSPERPPIVIDMAERDAPSFSQIDGNSDDRLSGVEVSVWFGPQEEADDLFKTLDADRNRTYSPREFAALVVARDG